MFQKIDIYKIFHVSKRKKVQKIEASPNPVQMEKRKKKGLES